MNNPASKDFNIDHQRHDRQGFYEVVYAEGKTNQQLQDICDIFTHSKTPLLVTRVKKSQIEVFENLTEKGRSILCKESMTYQWFPESHQPIKLKGIVNLISAGTSDSKVLKEAGATLSFFGAEHRNISDCGVAGVHRILNQQDLLEKANVNIVVAGMDGALPSVVGGLTSKPLIAVPTSVGYGASFAGISALLAMLNSCSSGISVVNIDNGFGAAMAALRILKS